MLTTEANSPSTTTTTTTTEHPMSKEHRNSPLPTGNFIRAVRDSCRACLTSTSEPHVKISDEGIRSFLNSIDPEVWKRQARKGATVGLPLKFDNIEDEVNIFALIDLLNFGSGYRKELHAYTKRGAFETMQFGVIAIYISNAKVDAQYMKSFSAFDASQLFGIPITREVPHPTIPIVRTMEPTELRPLADSIVQIMNETGTILEQGGYRNLGQFVLAMTKGEDCTAANLTEKLVRAFPAFRDMGPCNDQPTYLFKKAQIVCANLYRRFQSSPTNPFQFPDISTLPIFSDNVVPSMLIHHSILEVPDDLRTKIARDEALTFSEVTKLRAAAVVACEEIRRCAGSEGDGFMLDEAVKGMTEVELDYYLWRGAKECEKREEVKRVVYKDTVYF